MRAWTPSPDSEFPITAPATIVDRAAATPESSIPKPEPFALSPFAKEDRVGAGQ
jgi:hypothetical protein